MHQSKKPPLRWLFAVWAHLLSYLSPPAGQRPQIGPVGAFSATPRARYGYTPQTRPYGPPDAPLMAFPALGMGEAHVSEAVPVLRCSINKSQSRRVGPRRWALRSNPHKRHPLALKTFPAPCRMIHRAAGDPSPKRPQPAPWVSIAKKNALRAV